MADLYKGFKRTNYCGELDGSFVGREVAICGWVQRYRQLGGLIFVTLRDREGIVQCNFNESVNKELFDKAFTLRNEYVCAIKGVVQSRGEKDINRDMKTGEIEIIVTELRILSKAETTPFEITENSKVNEELRLKYRYLDLRRPDIAKHLYLRSRVAKVARDYFLENKFIEIETPILTKSTPEGARDYIVPSRVHPGKFYALPQSPQIYKQLLMLAGFDRYIQITKCFRDEDLRVDRQPEFTQIDLEMSFIDIDDIIAVNEGFLKKVCKEVLDLDIKTPFMRISYKDAMERYGSDKPDTRFGLELVDISKEVKDCGFKVFTDAVLNGGSVRAINVKGAADKFSRKEIDALAEFVKTYRAKGLAWVKLAEETTSSFAKFLSAEEMQLILNKMDAKSGDVVFIVADKDEVVFDSLGQLRLKCAEKLSLISKDEFNFLWVVDFPLFEYSEEDGRYYAKHHPFTSPMDEDIDKIESDPGKCRAKAYDIVLNGFEIGGGSIRIYDSNLQEKMFAALGFSEKEAHDRFGFLIDAFKYGTPPHGGLAYGLDRIVMILGKTDSIRDVIAFPKMQNASELMMQSPDFVEEKQLKELYIQIDEKGLVQK